MEHHDMTATAMMEKPPLYWEARRYCEERGITDMAELENVRQSLAFCEYTRQIQPYLQSAARIKAGLPLGEELDPVLMHTLRELQEHIAKRLKLFPWSDPLTSSAISLRI